jgi:uncharacterized protein
VFGTSAQVRLFGSRVDDEKRGGDIDLLVNTDVPYRDALNLKITFLGALSRRIGERRVDVVLVTPDGPRPEVVAVAMTEGVLIR